MCGIYRIKYGLKLFFGKNQQCGDRLHHNKWLKFIRKATAAAAASIPLIKYLCCMLYLKLKAVDQNVEYFIQGNACYRCCCYVQTNCGFAVLSKLYPTIYQLRMIGNYFFSFNNNDCDYDVVNDDDENRSVEFQPRKCIQVSYTLLRVSARFKSASYQLELNFISWL